MVEIWYTILAFTLVVYIVLDGRNFGAGAILSHVARTSDERLQVMAAIGPLWTWHEVWLLVTGGVLFAAFPRAMASAFAGYYLAIFLLLWSIILRGVSLEIGSHIDNSLWQQFWGFVFSVSSILLAILFGVAMGNLARGVPVDGDREFQMPFFTDFRATGQVGLLDWYSISMGVFFLVLLSAHGAAYLVHKTEGEVHDRSLVLARRLWAVVGFGLVIITIETVYLKPAWLSNLADRPLAWIAIATMVASSVAVWRGLSSDRETLAVLGSSLFIAGFLGTAAALMFPLMLMSTLGTEHSLTAHECASSRKALGIGLVWWPIAFVLACTYSMIIHLKYSGKVKPSRELQALRYP